MAMISKALRAQIEEGEFHGSDVTAVSNSFWSDGSNDTTSSPSLGPTLARSNSDIADDVQSIKERYQGPLWQSQVLDFIETKIGIPKENIEHILHPTAFQEDMFSSMKNEGHHPGRLVLGIPPLVDIGRLRTACYSVAQRMPLLRSRLARIPDLGTIQIVSQHPPPHQACTKVSAWLVTASEELNNVGSGVSPPRFVFSDCGVGDQHLMFIFSHLFLDEWSVQRVLQAIGEEYNTPNSINEKLYASVPHRSRPVLDGFEDYWVSQLAGVPPQDFPRVPLSEADGQPDLQAIDFEISFPKLNAAEPRTVLHAAWAMVVGQHSGSEDVIVGSLSNGRLALPGGPCQGLGQMSAFIPLRVQLDGGVDIPSFLRTLEETLIKGASYGPVSLNELGTITSEIRAANQFQTALAIRDVSYNETTTNLLDMEASQTWTQLDLVLEQYPISLLCRPKGDTWNIAVRYDQRWIKPSEMRIVLDHFKHNITQLCRQGSKGDLVGELEMLSPSDEEKIRDVNKCTPESIDTCAHDLLSNTAIRRGDATAVCSRTVSISFAQLEKMSTNLAHHLVGLGVGRGKFVTLYLEKTVFAAVAVLAVLKAGGAFVFLEPSHPHGRHEEIISQAKPVVMLASPAYSEKSLKLVDTVFPVDQTSLGSLPVKSANPCTVQPDDVAFASFTSGSTGKPKGVVHTHKTVSTYIVHAGKGLGLDEATRMLHHVAYSFVVVACDFLAVLAAGGCLCVVDADYTPADLMKAINDLDANAVFCTSSSIRSMSPESVPGLRTLYSGGEVMGQDIVDKWASKLSLINLYGSTEV